MTNSPYEELPRACREWVADVDLLMKRDWYLDLSGAGASEEDIRRYFSWGDKPYEFVEWYAEKYDLIDFRP